MAEAEARSIVEEATRSRGRVVWVHFHDPDLPSWTALELSYRSLPVAPPYITAVKTLVRLDLSHNCLETLPEDLGCLKRHTRPATPFCNPAAPLAPMTHAMLSLTALPGVSQPSGTVALPQQPRRAP